MSASRYSPPSHWASCQPPSSLGLLLDHLRTQRVLMVLDNLETLLEEGVDTGRMRAGYEAYGYLLRRVAQTEHQSCLFLTSREKADELLSLERSWAQVRTLRLARLIEAYAGNPLALNIVAQTIVDLFAGEIAPFLEQGEVVFGGIRELLAQLGPVFSPVTADPLLLNEAIQALRRYSLVNRDPQAKLLNLHRLV